MRTILVLTCCLALTAAVRAEDQQNQNNKNKTTNTKTVKTKAATNTHVQGARLQTHNNNLPAVQSNTHVQSNKLHSNTTLQSSKLHSNTTLQSNKFHSNTKLNSNAQLNSKALHTNTTPFHTQQFHLKNGPNPAIASVKFKQNYTIQGSQNWKGQKYWAFKNYHSQWHDQGWWNGHHNRIILISGGYYYWDNGYYYPAWGYDSANQYYPYDGPVYSYNDMPLDQEVANIQTALQQQGYYQGDIDGLIGPQTRAALAQYQQANGLEPTSAIDQPTVESLLGNS
jgi:Putative peptidoglycan binding domain